MDLIHRLPNLLEGENNLAISEEPSSDGIESQLIQAGPFRPTYRMIRACVVQAQWHEPVHTKDT